MYRNPKYLYGDDETFVVPAHLNFGKFILSHLRRKENEVAMVTMETEKQITYKEVTNYSISIAVKLGSLGIGRGDVVVLGAESGLEFMPTALGILYTGATFSGLGLNPGRANILHVFNVTKAKKLLCSKQFWLANKDTIKTIERIQTILLIDGDKEILREDPKITNFNVENDNLTNIDNFEPASVRGQDDVAIILFSSGTTGLPKGVMLTHLNCIASCETELFMDESLQTVYMTGLFEHNYDFFMTAKFWILGRKIVFHHDVIYSFSKIDEYKIDIALITPARTNILIKDKNFGRTKMDNLKILYCRSSILHSETADKVKQKMPNLGKVAVGLGMTECGEPASCLWSKKGIKPGSCGNIARGIVSKVIDINTEEPLGPNENGEIRVKGPQLMKGYIDIDPTTYLDAEGFYKTGDLGYYDEDGCIYIIDRIKDIIDHFGTKISPQFLENVIIKHPAVLEVAVVGKPDPVAGELPMAFIVKQQGVTITEQELIEFMRPEVSEMELLPGGVKFIDGLPRNARGKVLRRELKNITE